MLLTYSTTLQKKTFPVMKKLYHITLKHHRYGTYEW